MRSVVFILITLLVFSPCVGAVPETNTTEEKRVDWFSDYSRLYPPALADPREAQVRVGYLQNGNANSYLDMALGGDIGLVREAGDDPSWTLTIRALITSRFRFFSKYIDQQNSDYLGGAAFGFKAGPGLWEILLYHQSSHLGDGAFENEGKVPFNYSYEALRLEHSRFIGETFRWYLGADIKVRASPLRLWGKTTAIAGAEWHFLPTLPDLFTALDVKFKGENSWAPNTSLILGYELGDPKTTDRRQRLFLEVFNGYSNMGQYSSDREFYVFSGFGFTY